MERLGFRVEHVSLLGRGYPISPDPKSRLTRRLNRAELRLLVFRRLAASIPLRRTVTRGRLPTGATALNLDHKNHSEYEGEEKSTDEGEAENSPLVAGKLYRHGLPPLRRWRALLTK